MVQSWQHVEKMSAPSGGATDGGDNDGFGDDEEILLAGVQEVVGGDRLDMRGFADASRAG